MGIQDRSYGAWRFRGFFLFGALVILYLWHFFSMKGEDGYDD